MPNLNLYRTEYEKVVGKTYGTLSIREKQTVYAMEIYEDSKDALTAFDIYSQEDLPEKFIEDQCRSTFGYKDSSIIPPVI